MQRERDNTQTHDLFPFLEIHFIYFHFIVEPTAPFSAELRESLGESLCRGVAGSYSLSLAVQTCSDSPLPSVKQNPVSVGHTEPFSKPLFQPCDSLLEWPIALNRAQLRKCPLESGFISQ